MAENREPEMTADQIRACLRLGIYVPAHKIEAALRARAASPQGGPNV
jgi:hypothetical protein